MKKPKQNSIPCNGEEQQKNPQETKATPKPDGKGKLDLMFKFQDIFSLLILAYDFWISEYC